MTVTRPPQSHAAIQAELATALRNVATEAEGIAGAASLIANKIAEVQANGGTVQTAPQVIYLTGAFARLLKDLGVVEHLQKHGAAAQRRALIKNPYSKRSIR